MKFIAMFRLMSARSGKPEVQDMLKLYLQGPKRSFLVSTILFLLLMEAPSQMGAFVIKKNKICSKFEIAMTIEEIFAELVKNWHQTSLKIPNSAYIS